MRTRHGNRRGGTIREKFKAILGEKVMLKNEPMWQGDRIDTLIKERDDAIMSGIHLYAKWKSARRLLATCMRLLHRHATEEAEIRRENIELKRMLKLADNIVYDVGRILAICPMELQLEYDDWMEEKHRRNAK